MARSDYLVLAWREPGAPAAAALRQRLRGEPEWRLAAETPMSAVYRTTEDLPIAALPDDAGFILGRMTPRVGEAAPRHMGRGGASAWARQASDACWGSYLVLLHEPGADEAVAVFRDPSGALGALNWRVDDGVVVVASDLRPVPPWLRPRRLRMDWDRIAAFTAAPAIGVGAPLFTDMALTAPGDLDRLGANGRVTEAIWRPHRSVVARADPTPTEAAEALRQAVDAAVEYGVRDYSGLLLDVSGGLDSAILAGALHRVGALDRVAALINRYGDRPEGDERVYARAVAERHGRELTECHKPLAALEEVDLMEVADATWPAVNGVDPVRDRDMAARLSGIRRGAAMSGQGGDAVFFQMPTALVLADAMAQGGLGALRGGLAADIARRTHTSVWDVLRQARRARTRFPRVAPLSALATDAVRRQYMGETHAWVAEAADLPPARRLQIGAIANAQVYRQDCRRRRAGDLIYPLLAQPVVEAALAVPIPLLAGAAYDRLFARAAFADYIPDIVRRRRSKGSLTSHYARWIAESLPMLRPFLLDGCLAEAGVLDRARLDRALDPEALIWAPEAGDIINAAAAEAWVRHWQGHVPDVGRAGAT